MGDFNNLKVGNKLLRTGRKLGGAWNEGKFRLTEWIELEVTRVTPKFYFIGDKKYPKDKDGKHFGELHYFPGEGGAPLVGNSDEFDRQKILHHKLFGFMPHITAKLNKMPTLEIAAEFADRVRQLEKEMGDAAEND